MFLVLTYAEWGFHLLQINYRNENILINFIISTYANYIRYNLKNLPFLFLRSV